MASKATPKTVSEKDYKFVDDLSEEYTCQVCMKLLNEPQATDCCGQHFCRACLDCWFQQTGKKQCPHCRSETFAHILYLPLKRKINELKVYCSNKEKGCGLIMKLEELDKHLSTDNPNGCSYVTVQCPNKGCDESCLQKDLANHVSNKCTQRKVKCEYCGEAGTYKHITKGHLRECQEYPMDCPRKCNTVRDLKHKDLEAHKEVCPLEPVECPFREAGCNEEVVRNELDSHLMSNTQQHLLNLMTAYQTLAMSHHSLMVAHEKLKQTDHDRRSAVESIASEVDKIQRTVKDQTLIKSLKEISTKLNQAAYVMKKEGDEISFTIPCGSIEWESPTLFIQNLFQLSLKVASNKLNIHVTSTVRVDDASRPKFLTNTYTYDVTIKLNCHQHTRREVMEATQTHNLVLKRSTVPMDETISMPSGYQERYYEKCTITIVLNKITTQSRWFANFFEHFDTSSDHTSR